MNNQDSHCRCGSEGEQVTRISPNRKMYHSAACRT
jgi:hypothetical protein